MPVESRQGRGATRNPTPARFNLQERHVEGEWLDQVEALDGVPKRRTTVTIEHPKSILTRNSSPDIGFDRSVNAYRGCEHGCIYCYARPTHEYLGFSAGLAALYGLLYGLLSAEDYALLMGSLMLFGLLGVFMVLTRKLDWYGIGAKSAKPLEFDVEAMR